MLTVNIKKGKINMSAQEKSSGQPQDSASQEQNQDVVKYETYQKVLGEKKKRDEEVRTLREQVEQFNAQKKQLEEAALKEKEDFKRLFETRDQDLKQTKDELDSLRQSINDSKKMRGFLSALKSPLEESYWGLVDLDKIPLDPTNGKPDEATVVKYAEEFQKSHWRLFDNMTNKMPNSGPNNDATIGLSYEEWKRLPPSEQRKRLKEVK